MADLSGYSVVFPVVDPDEKLQTVIDGVLKQGFKQIILVDDGSKAENRPFVEAATRDSRVKLLCHDAHKGRGAALKTAFRWFLENCPDGLGVVTAGIAYDPVDVKSCALETLKTGRITLGVRSGAGSKLNSLIFKFFVGMSVADPRTGLRALCRSHVESLADVDGERFEYETNMLLAMKKQQLEFNQVQISAKKTDEQFRLVGDSFRIYMPVLGHFLKYGISAVSSAIIDGALVWLFNILLNKTLFGWYLTFVTTVCARTISSLCNFFMNKKLVFKDESNTFKAMLKYYMVALPNMLLQFFMNEMGYRLLGITEQQSFLRLVIHYVMMGVLFIATYAIQKRWVFTNKKEGA